MSAISNSTTSTKGSNNSNISTSGNSSTSSRGIALAACCHLLWMKHQAMVDEAVVVAPLTSHGDHFGVMERAQVGHPTAPITRNIIITIIVKYFELFSLSS